MDLEQNRTYFENIYKEEADKVFRFVLLRVSNREESLDITEEVFYKFWQAVNNGEEILSFRAFLYKIARNKVIDWYRKKKPESLDMMMEVGEEGEWRAFQVADDSSHERIIASSEAEWVLKSFDKLPPQYGEVVRMRFLDDLSLTEISEILEVSVNAVSLRLNRALQKLREELGIEIENKNE